MSMDWSAWAAATLAVVSGSTWSLSLALAYFRVRVYSILETAFHFCAGAAVPDLTAGFQRPLNDFDSRSARTNVAEQG